LIIWRRRVSQQQRNISKLLSMKCWTFWFHVWLLSSSVQALEVFDSIRNGGNYSVPFRASGAIVGPRFDCGILRFRNELGPSKNIRVCARLGREFTLTREEDIPQQVAPSNARICLNRNPAMLADAGLQSMDDFLAHGDGRFITFQQHEKRRAMRTMAFAPASHAGPCEGCDASSAPCGHCGGCLTVDQCAFDNANEGRDCVPDPQSCTDQMFCTSLGLRDSAACQATARVLLETRGSTPTPELIADICSPCKTLHRIQYGGQPVRQACNLHSNQCVPDRTEAIRYSADGVTECKDRLFGLFGPKVWDCHTDNSYRIVQTQQDYQEVGRKLTELQTDFEAVGDKLTAMSHFLSSGAEWRGNVDQQWAKEHQWQRDWQSFQGDVQQQTNAISRVQVLQLANLETLTSHTQQQFQQIHSSVLSLVQQLGAAFTGAETQRNLTQQILEHEAAEALDIAQRLQQLRSELSRVAESQRDNSMALAEARSKLQDQREVTALFHNLSDFIQRDLMVPFVTSINRDGRTFGRRGVPIPAVQRYSPFEQQTLWFGARTTSGDKEIHMVTFTTVCDQMALLNSTYSWYSDQDAVTLLGPNPRLVLNSPPPPGIDCETRAPNAPPNAPPPTCRCWVDVSGQYCTITGESAQDSDVRGPTYLRAHPGPFGETRNTWDPGMSLIDVKGCTSAARRDYTSGTLDRLKGTFAGPLRTQTDWNGWIQERCNNSKLPAQQTATDVSIFFMHSLNMKRVWSIPRNASKCAVQYDEALVQNGIQMHMMATFGFALKLFGQRRRTMQVQAFGTLPERGLAIVSEPFADGLGNMNETSSCHGIEFLSLHPQTMPVTRWKPGRLIKEIMVEVEQPDGSFVPAGPEIGISLSWTTSEPVKSDSRGFRTFGYLECARRPCVVPTRIIGQGPVLEGERPLAKFERFLYDIPQNLYSTDPQNRRGASNYFGVPARYPTNVDQKHASPDIYEWHEARGLDIKTSFDYDTAAGQVDPSRYRVRLIASPTDPALGVLVSPERTGENELATFFDSMACELALGPNDNTADDLNTTRCFYRGPWSLLGTVTLQNVTLYTLQPTTRCPSTDLFHADAELQTSLKLFIEPPSPTSTTALRLHTSDPAGDPSCTRNNLILVPPSTGFRTTLALCASARLDVRVTTTDSQQTCWAWNATATPRSIVHNGRSERRIVEWSFQDSVTVALAVAAMRMAQTHRRLLDLQIDTVQRFAEQRLDANVVARTARFQQITDEYRAEVRLITADLESKIQDDMSNAWQRGTTLTQWAAESRTEYLAAQAELQEQLNALPDPSALFAREASILQQAVTLTDEIRRLSRDFENATQQFQQIISITKGLTATDWGSSIGTKVWKCLAVWQQLFDQNPGVPPAQVVNAVAAQRAEKLDRQQRQRCEVVGFLSMFNFACGFWSPIRPHLAVTFILVFVMLFWILLPGIGHNITAGAYVLRKDVATGKIQMLGLMDDSTNALEERTSLVELTKQPSSSSSSTASHVNSSPFEFG
jgi:hypothetical protein